MKRPTTTQDDAGENDAVWKLLDHSPSVTPSARFIDDTVRAARLAGQPAPWWKSLMAPAPITGLAATASALALIFTLLQPVSETPGTVITHSQDTALIEEIAETETLIAAVDHMDQFSDTELVSLIGF